MTVRKKQAYRASSYMSGHLLARDHQVQYNVLHSKNQYTLAKPTATKPSTSKLPASEQIQKLLTNTIIADKFELHRESDKEGLRCRNCKTFVKASGPFEHNVLQHEAKKCASFVEKKAPKRKGASVDPNPAPTKKIQTTQGTAPAATINHSPTFTIYASVGSHRVTCVHRCARVSWHP
jgi:hypothetical protein